MQYTINPGRLELAKGIIASALGRGVTYKEFAEMAELNPHTLSSIMQGDSPGSIYTASKILTVLRRHGANWSLDELEESKVLPVQ